MFFTFAFIIDNSLWLSFSNEDPKIMLFIVKTDLEQVHQAALYNQWLLWWNLTLKCSQEAVRYSIFQSHHQTNKMTVCQIVVAFYIDFVLIFLLIVVPLVWNFHSYNLIVYFCKIMSKSYLLISKMFYVFTAHQIANMKPNVILI